MCVSMTICNKSGGIDVSIPPDLFVLGIVSSVCTGTDLEGLRNLIATLSYFTLKGQFHRTLAHILAKSHSYPVILHPLPDVFFNKMICSQKHGSGGD
jgi:hypothetical protein